MEIFFLIFTLYFGVKLYLSVAQIAHIKKHLKEEPVLLERDKYIESGLYALEKERLSILDSSLEYLLFIFWIGFGFSYLEGLLSGSSFFVINVAFVLLFLLFNQIISMPTDIYKTFVLDKKFGFTTTTYKLYALDTLKALLMTIVLGGVVIYGVAYIISTFENWWFFGFLFIFLLIIFVNAIYPTLIAPIFNKFTPLEDLELKEKIERLLSSSGFKTNGIFVMDASKRDARLNAYFGGLGSSKRVVLFDTLLQKITQNELLAILGHELGHFKNRDMYKNIAISGALMLLVFYIFGNLNSEIFKAINTEEAPYSIIALIVLLSSSILFFIMPLISYFSRKNEYEADRYGSELSSAKDLISALLKLNRENKSFPKSHNLYIAFYYSHPPVLERLKELGYRE